MQKTNFGYEVLVGDDSSTDGTSEIVAEYAKKYPDIIKHIKRSSNIGALENFMDICDRVTSKYAHFVMVMIFGQMKINSKSSMILWNQIMM